MRWEITQHSAPLARQFWMFGGGAGSFVRLFTIGERLEWVKPAYVNAAHDDYLQLVIELGLPGLLALALFAVALGRGALAGWRRGNGFRSSVLVTGLLIVVLYALHSVVDYPLRRPATWPLFLVACAMILRPQRSDPQRTAAVAGDDGRRRSGGDRLGRGGRQP